MRLLVLGGTAFLSRAVAAEAVARGHDVVCAARGVSGSIADGTSLVVWDRSDPAVPPDLTVAAYDAVVDVSRTPSHVRHAVAAFPDAHWVFVSTCNVYADTATRGARAGDLPLLEPLTTDEDPASGPEVYGAMKVACEQLVLEGTASAMVVRAGLIVGPGDGSGRFAYWPSRLADGGEVLVPESPDDPVQLVDVRDLAAWLVDGAERRITGVFDGISQPTTRRALLEEIASALVESSGFETGAERPPQPPVLTWVPADFLAEHEVAEWSGPRSLPLWVSDPEWQGFMAHDVTPSIEAGLRIRPFGETAADTLAWLRATPGATVTGLTRDEEREILQAWHAR